MVAIAKFTWKISGQGIEVFATRDSKRVTLSSLTESEKFTASQGLARFQAAIENDDQGVRELTDQSGYWISPSVVENMTGGQAASVGLPVDTPYSLWVRFTGPLVAANSSAILAWHDISGSKISAREETGLLFVGSKAFRIPSALARISRACVSFNSARELLDARLAAISELKAAISSASGESVGTDKQLADMRFRHASALSLDIHTGKDGINFDPVFFNADTRDQYVETGTLVDDSESILTPELQRNLNSEFRRSMQVKPTYVLGRGEYLYIDPALRPALEVVKEHQERSPEERARFARSPKSFIKEKYSDSGIDEEGIDKLVENAFVESESFSQRVIDVGLWKPPVLPFIRRAPNSWFPEAFGLKIGSRTITIPEDQLPILAKSVAQAIKDGTEKVRVFGTGEEIPATRDALDSLNAMVELFLKLPPVTLEEPEVEDEEGSGPGQRPPEVLKEKSILIVQDNFVSESFVAKFNPRTDFKNFEEPEGLISKLKEHQIHGVSWLQKCWSLGYPGALLADDMGLGKTLQALAFIAWLRAKRQSLGKTSAPVLIVAPISLLGNWQSEAKRHLLQGLLGKMALLYGDGLSRFRRANFKRSDVIEGQPTLDLHLLKENDWILTTYETMRDYHMSLGKIDFSLIIFDEMQKIKNPESMMTNAAQALQADFQIGLTGTPIENSLADIWTLFDTLMPSSLGLGTLKDFLAHYRLDATEALKQLKAKLTEESGGNPPPMLRRMKSDVAKDLPEKIEKSVQKEMPEIQAVAYVQAVQGISSSKTNKSKLEAFHRIRGISLHPRFADESSLANGESYVSESARLASCFSLLDKIKASGEKALLFVESIAMQEWLAFYLREKYKLERSPGRIFGDTSADRRTAIVERFQDSPEGVFDVLILSPKAAGVGLTLTAATHVIHLTRWWNPAVEDQCTDRAYRIGQSKNVTVYYLQAVHPLYGEGSFDCILDQLLSKKRALSTGMLMPTETGDELDAIFKRLSELV
jgi:superfamily II DNA or RNA helicase